MRSPWPAKAIDLYVELAKLTGGSLIAEPYWPPHKRAHYETNLREYMRDNWNRRKEIFAVCPWLHGLVDRWKAERDSRAGTAPQGTQPPAGTEDSSLRGPDSLAF